MILPRSIVPIFALLVAALSAWAAPDSSERFQEAKAVVDSLHFQRGDIDLHKGVAKLKLPDTLKYLGPEDTETVLVKLWGNPPMRERTLGMIMPAGMSPIQEESWAVIIEGYQEDGYVKDDDAAKINYTELLKTMKADAHTASEERVKKGYPAMELIGFATPPRYDAQAKKLYWAKEYEVAGSSEHSLNYNIRILGRRGTLVLNAIAGVSQLAAIEQATPTILGAVEFQEGHRYVDFNPATDKVATYGIAALIAGGVLTKAGVFKMILPALLAAKKFVVVGVAAIAAFIKKLFGRRDERVS